MLCQFCKNEIKQDAIVCASCGAYKTTAWKHSARNTDAFGGLMLLGIWCNTVGLTILAWLVFTFLPIYNLVAENRNVLMNREVNCFAYTKYKQINRLEERDTLLANQKETGVLTFLGFRLVGKDRECPNDELKQEAEKNHKEVLLTMQSKQRQYDRKIYFGTRFKETPVEGWTYGIGLLIIAVWTIFSFFAGNKIVKFVSGIWKKIVGVDREIWVRNM